MRIPGFSIYDVTENGDVTNVCTGEKVAKHVGTYKYIWVYVVPDGEVKPRQVNLHTLVALAFHGPRPDGFIVKFEDGNPHNVTASNLSWVKRGSLARKTSAVRTPRANRSCTPESVQLVYDAMVTLGKPVTMLELSCMLEVPYTTVRYSMYGLMALGKAQPAEGGYTIV